MFERGDVVVVIYKDDDLLDGLALCTGENKYLWITRADDNVEGEWEATGTFARSTPYTGPIYERLGQRFVPSGEEPRLPKKGEHYYNETTNRASGPSSLDWTEQSICNDKHKGTRRILLPIPALPDAHKFKVGQWVKFDGGEPRFQITGFDERRPKVAFGGPHKGGYHVERMEKLPGRPLTPADLMQVVSGVRLTIHCDACGCKGWVGTIWPACSQHGVAFFHKGVSDHVATFDDGAIVFADGAEGNIYVVDE